MTVGKSLLKKDVFERVASTVVAAFGSAMVLVSPDQVFTWRFWIAVGTAGGVSLVKSVTASGVGNRDSASLTRDV